ncbi:MAG: arylsulfatase A-like enzyme [Planctomycetota bacterium]
MIDWLGAGFGLYTLCVLFGGLESNGAVPNEDKKPELVLYVLFDTLGADHVSHLGYDRLTTPNLDELATRGIAFENAVSPAPYAVGSIPSLLTGRYPDSHGLTGYKGELPKEEVTLAESLSQAGYRTVAISAVYNGGAHYGNDQGFDRFAEMHLGPGPEGTRQVQFQGKLCHYPTPGESLKVVREELDGMKAGESIFLFVHFLQPHAPYSAPPQFLERFRDSRFPGPFDPNATQELRKRTLTGVPGPEDIESTIHLYDANVAWADDALGQLVAELKSRELFEESLIVATGNHGEGFWEHGLRGHGVHLYGELMRVPAVLKLPASDKRFGLRRSALVSNLDFVPTILERLSLDFPPRPYDGVSLMALVNDPKFVGHEKLLMRNEPKRTAKRRIAMRWPDKKVIITLPAEGDTKEAFYDPLYFDLGADPRESHNLAETQPEATARAVQELLDYHQAVLEGELKRE